MRYATLMTDAYPPFRLDMGGHESATNTAAPTSSGPSRRPGSHDQGSASPHTRHRPMASRCCAIGRRGSRGRGGCRALEGAVVAVGASDEELKLAVPGDELVPDADLDGHPGGHG